MIYIMNDVETNGPAPGIYSMLSLGAVAVEEGLTRRFYEEMRPLNDNCVPEAIAACGYTMEQAYTFKDPMEVMRKYAAWVSTFEKPRFISDNNGFDWSFVNYYLWRFTGGNPYGHSSDNLRNLFQGLENSRRANFRRLRKTKHDHNALNDAIGNGEAMLSFCQKHGWPLQ